MKLQIRTLGVLGDSQSKQQNDNAKNMRHVSSEAEYIHTHDSGSSQWCLLFHLFPLSTTTATTKTFSMTAPNLTAGDCKTFEKFEKHVVHGLNI
jgi:hypothetical protein